MRFHACVVSSLVLYLAAVAGLGSGGCSVPTGAASFGSSDGGDGGLFGTDASASRDAGTAPVDATSCAPGSVSTFVPVYKPTPRYADKCTAKQLETVVDDCFDPATDSQSACNAWASDARNSACRGCWSGPAESMSSSTDTGSTTTWTPYIFVANPGQTTYVNVSGCIALADPSELPCAQTIQNDFACELDACGASCPVPISGSTANAMNALEACFVSADMGGCSIYATEAKACRKTVAADSAAAFCLDAEKEDPDALLEYFTLACGEAPPGGDAGAGDAAPGIDGAVFAGPDATSGSGDAGGDDAGIDDSGGSDAGVKAEVSTDSESIGEASSRETGADAAGDGGTEPFREGGADVGADGGVAEAGIEAD